MTVQIHNNYYVHFFFIIMQLYERRMCHTKNKAEKDLWLQIDSQFMTENSDTVFQHSLEWRSESTFCNVIYMYYRYI